jgi:N-acetylneuraminic acid mutarotase
MIVFGGFKEGERCNDIFSYGFTDNTWKQIKPANGSPMPTPIAGHSASVAKDPETGADIMIIFGGKDDENMKLNHLWKYDFSTNMWTQLEPTNAEHDLPMGRSGHSSVLFKGKYIAVFGGIFEITRELNDCHLYDIKSNKWFNLFEETGPASPKRLRDDSSPMSTKKTGEIKQMTERTAGIASPIKGRRRRAKYEIMAPGATAIVENKEEK